MGESSSRARCTWPASSRGAVGPFATRGDTVPTSPTSGSGQWVEVLDSELDDLRLKLSGLDVSATGASSRRPPNNQGVDNNDPAYSGRFNREIMSNGTLVNEFDQFFATNRPEDIEVAEDGTIYVALTSNTSSTTGQQPAVQTPSANDQHGSVRRMQENDNANPDASLAFTWADYAAGGPRGGTDPPGPRGLGAGRRRGVGTLPARRPLGGRTQAPRRAQVSAAAQGCACRCHDPQAAFGGPCRGAAQAQRQDQASAGPSPFGQRTGHRRGDRCGGQQEDGSPVGQDRLGRGGPGRCCCPPWPSARLSRWAPRRGLPSLSFVQRPSLPSFSVPCSSRRHAWRASGQRVDRASAAVSGLSEKSPSTPSS